ncbi:MAG: hypothetical protein J6B48_02200 [Clostridia bacterium]|nr:hypothetical protein [Clostridia bacterium]
MTDTLKRMKIIIIVLAVLLGLSLTALAGVIIYGQLNPSGGSAVVPDNYIEPTGSELNTGAKITQLRTGPVLLCASVPTVNLSGNIPVMALSKTVITSDSAKETVISIYKNHAEDSEPFNCSNMFPGDSETNVYLVEVSHKGTVTVRFHADIRTGYEKLSEVLKCKVELRGKDKVLYDGLMRDMPESINHRISSVFKKTTELTYDITVYLDTSVGNEYMNKELVADFRWWVEESGGDPTPPPTPGPDETDPDETDPDETDPDDTTKPDDTTEPDDTTKPDDTTEPDDTTKPDDTTEPGDTTNPDDTTPPDDTTKPTEPDDTDDGELVYPPQTGDNSHFCIWFWIAMFSLLVNIILLWPKRRRNRDEQEGEEANEQ